MENEEVEKKVEVTESVNVEKVNIETPKPVVSKIVPKIFMSKDSKITIALTSYYNNATGEMVMVLPKEYSTDESFDNIFTKVEHEFVFTRVPYDRLNKYRTRSMVYNSEDKTNTINTLTLREYLLVYHLIDWNLVDEDGNKIDLKFDPNGALSNETLQMIYQLPPNMLDMVLTNYEKRMNISNN